MWLVCYALRSSLSSIGEFFTKHTDDGALSLYLFIRQMNGLVYLMLGIWIYEYTKSRQPPSSRTPIGRHFLCIHAPNMQFGRWTKTQDWYANECARVQEYQPKQNERRRKKKKNYLKREHFFRLFVRSFIRSVRLSKIFGFFFIICELRNKWDNSVAIADLHHSQLFGVLSIWHIQLFSVTVQWQ